MNEKEWLKQVSQQIKEKMYQVATRNQDKIPYTANAGEFDDQNGKNINWWTNGFWGGAMWQMYHATGIEMYRDIAIKTEEKLDKVLMNAEAMDHDSGFRWLPTAVANYRLTGDRNARNRGLLAADNMAGRFNLAGNFFRAWNNGGKSDINNCGLAIIDCMMNLPLLYWAHDELKDPRYMHMAMHHADTVIKNFIREDGSVCHIVEFDPKSGKFIQSFGGQGYGVGSSWTRGQSWALYGFALSYLHTKEERYLNAARKVAHYIISSIPENGQILIDFRQPAACRWQDNSAAAIMACGFLELESLVEDSSEKELYHESAILLLKMLCKEVNFKLSSDPLLEKCSASFHEEKHEYPIIYGDYYFIEAIWKLTGEELFIW